jgi:hypothetical protein
MKKWRHDKAASAHGHLGLRFALRLQLRQADPAQPRRSTAALHGNMNVFASDKNRVAVFCFATLLLIISNCKYQQRKYRGGFSRGPASMADGLDCGVGSGLGAVALSASPMRFRQRTASKAIRWFASKIGTALSLAPPIALKAAELHYI